MEGQTSPWDVSSTDHQEILPVSREGWPKGYHRGSDHDSIRTGPTHRVKGSTTAEGTHAADSAKRQSST